MIEPNENLGFQHIPDDSVTVGFHYKRKLISTHTYRRMRTSSRTYLIAEHRHTNVAFFIDTRVIDLGRERDLCDSQLLICRSVLEGSNAQGLRRTDGALNGKFSGRVTVKRNVPPLYGL